MTRPAGIVDVVRAEAARSFVRDVVRFVRHPSGCDEEREPVRARRPDLSGRKLERFVLGDPPEPSVPSMTDHRVGQPAELPKLLRGLRTQLFHVLKAPDAEGSHRVQREEIESNGAEMDSFHREVAEPRGPEGAPIADAVPKDPPGEDGSALVVPGEPDHLAVVVGLREAEAKGDCADAPDPFPSRLPRWSPLSGRFCRRPRSQSMVAPSEGRSKGFVADSTSRRATECSSRPATPHSSSPGSTGFSCGPWAVTNASCRSSMSSIRCGRFIDGGWPRGSCGPTSPSPRRRRSSIVSGVASSMPIGSARSIPIWPPTWT